LLLPLAAFVSTLATCCKGWQLQLETAVDALAAAAAVLLLVTAFAVLLPLQHAVPLMFVQNVLSNFLGLQQQ
jgi:hypothetical protein